MALSYRRPSLFLWAHICLQCVCAQTYAFVYVYMQTHNTVGAHLWWGNRKPPASLCTISLSSYLPKATPTFQSVPANTEYDRTAQR